VLLRRLVAALDPLGERHLLVGGEERHLPDLAEVEPQGVERGLDGEVQLRCSRLLGGHDRLLVGQRLVLLAFDQLDRVVDEVGREVLELLLREVHVLERLDDLVVGQEPLFLSLLDESVELFDVRKGDIDGEHEPLFLPGG